MLVPDRSAFERDPFGYSSLSWMRWAIAQNAAGASIDLVKEPSSKDLKDPVLWLLHAHALSEAAANVVQNEPHIDHLPDVIKAVCHGQYFAVGLMLVGYSLEVCLKGMLIMQRGIESYSAEEKKV